MEYREKIRQIKSRMLQGQITYEQAKAEAAPIIKEMNDKAKAIASKYGKRHTPLTFTYVMR